MPSIKSTWQLETSVESVATRELSTSRCRSLNVRSVELISPVTKYFCAACFDPQCRSTKCTACKARTTMTVDLIKLDANCLLKQTNGRVSTTGNDPSLRSYLHINLEETIEYALTQTKTLHAYNLIRWTRASWVSFDVNWTSYTDLAEFDHPQPCTEQVACG